MSRIKDTQLASEQGILTTQQKIDLLALDNDAVKKAGTQSITGAKSFILPVIVPTAVLDSHSVNLGQVKALAGNDYDSGVAFPAIETNQLFLRTDLDKWYSSVSGSWVEVF